MLKWKVGSKQSYGESTDGGAAVIGAGVSGPAAAAGAATSQDLLQQCLQAATADVSRIGDKGRQLLSALSELPPEQQEQAKDVVATSLALKSQLEVIQSHVLQLVEQLQQKPPCSPAAPAVAVCQPCSGSASSCAGSPRERREHIGRRSNGSPDDAAIAASTTAGGSRQCVRRCKSCLMCSSCSEAVQSCHGHLARQSTVDSSGKPRSRWQSASPLLPRTSEADAAPPTEKELTCRQYGNAACGQPPKVLVREASNSSREGADDWDPARTCLSSGSCCGGGGGGGGNGNGGCSLLGPVADSDDQSSMTSGWSDSSKETPSTGDGSTRSFPLQDKATPVAQARRTRVIKDLVESERKYCTVLSAIVKNYMEVPLALEDCSDQDIRAIFPLSLKNIYKFHRKLLALLDKRAGAVKDVDVVGDVFTRFTESLDQSSIFTEYKDYIGNFPVAISTIRRLQKSSGEFRKWVKRCRRSSVLVLDLTNLLLIPVCRVPGYVSTLQQLLQFTEPEHPDAFHLTWCLPKFEAVASDLSQAIAKSVTMAKNRMSDDGIADESVIEEEESARWNACPERSGSAESVLVRCKDGSERRQADEVVVLSAVAASESSSRVGLVAGGDYRPRGGSCYTAAQSLLNGLVTLPRKQRKDRDARWTAQAAAPQPPRGTGNGSVGPAAAEGQPSGESLLRNVKVTPQGNSYCVSSSSSTLPRLPRRTIDVPLSAAAAPGSLSDVSSAAAITAGLTSDRLLRAPAPAGSAACVGGSRLIHEKSRDSRLGHHASQFDLRHAVQSPASKSAIHRWMHASQPDLLRTKSDSEHSLSGWLPSAPDCMEHPTATAGADDGKRQKRKGFGALLKFFFAKKILQKPKAAASARKGPQPRVPEPESAAKSGGSSNTLFTSRSKTSSTSLSSASGATLACSQQLTDSGHYGCGSDAVLSDLDLPDGRSVPLANGFAATMSGKDNLI